MPQEQLGQEQRAPGASGNGSAPTNGEQARAALHDIGDTLGEQADVQKARAADRVGRAADAVRDAAHGMEGQEAWIAGLVERGADELARMADTLRTSDFRSLLNQAEDFARRQPVLFVGAGAIVGFALTRAARAGMVAASQPTSRRMETAAPYAATPPTATPPTATPPAGTPPAGTNLGSTSHDNRASDRAAFSNSGTDSGRNGGYRDN